MAVVSASEAARRLGISPGKVIRLVEQGFFPGAYKIEGVVRVPVSAIKEKEHLLKKDGNLSPSEAGRLLSVAPGTIKRWFKKGLLPNAFKIGCAIRIPPSDIEALKKPFKKEAV